VFFLSQFHKIDYNNFTFKKIYSEVLYDHSRRYFYKKEKFTGSYKGMRYLVKKEKDDAENDIFRATVWPGPYNFSTTPDDQKISATFPFTEEGRQQAVDWMNEQWRSRSEWGIMMHS